MNETTEPQTAGELAEQIRETLAGGKYYMFHLHNGIFETARFFARDARVHSECEWIVEILTDREWIELDTIERTCSY
jgi:hypothetical protein